MKKLLLWISVLGSFAASAYCLYAFAFFAWLTANPDHLHKDAATTRAVIYAIGILVFFVLGLVGLIVLWRTRPKQN